MVGFVLWKWWDKGEGRRPAHRVKASQKPVIRFQAVKKTGNFVACNEITRQVKNWLSVICGLSWALLQIPPGTILKNRKGRRPSFVRPGGRHKGITAVRQKFSSLICTRNLVFVLLFILWIRSPGITFVNDLPGAFLFKEKGIVGNVIRCTQRILMGSFFETVH